MSKPSFFYVDIFSDSLILESGICRRRQQVFESSFASVLLIKWSKNILPDDLFWKNSICSFLFKRMSHLYNFTLNDYNTNEYVAKFELRVKVSFKVLKTS